MSVIPKLKRLRKKDCEFETSPGYKKRPCLKKPRSKQNKQKPKGVRYEGQSEKGMPRRAATTSRTGEQKERSGMNRTGTSEGKFCRADAQKSPHICSTSALSVTWVAEEGVCIHHILFILSPVNGHLSCFLLLAIINNVTRTSLL
jgi:hypothetical protein